MSMHARRFGNCSYKYSKHLFDHKMPNDSIDAKGTRAKALGTRARGRKPWVQGRETSDVNAC